MKVVKRIIVGVLIAALASAGIYTGLMHVKKSKVTEVPVTSVSNLIAAGDGFYLFDAREVFTQFADAQLAVFVVQVGL